MVIYRIGDIETITIPLLNKSILTATNVVVTITLSEGLKYSTSTPTSGVVATLSERDITWTIPAVTASQSLSLLLSVEFTSTCNDNYTINWEVTSDQTEAIASNNTECYTFSGFTCCQALQCLAIQKDEFTGLTSGTTVTLTEDPLMLLMITRNGLETLDYTQDDTTIEFGTEFGGEGETIIVTYFKQK